MLLWMTLQKDKEFMFYLQILQNDCTPTGHTAEQSGLSCIRSFLALNIWTDSAYCAQSASLSETARLDLNPTTNIFFPIISLSLDVYMTMNSVFLHNS